MLRTQHVFCTFLMMKKDHTSEASAATFLNVVAMEINFEIHLERCNGF